MPHQFFQLLGVTYAPDTLEIQLALLVEGQPDGHIGTPLVVGDHSVRYTISFKGVSEFRATAEPCYVKPESVVDMSAFLFECLASEYAGRSCPFGVGPRTSARHFCVFSEDSVIEVLSSVAPTISEQCDGIGNPITAEVL